MTPRLFRLGEPGAWGVRIEAAGAEFEQPRPVAVQTTGRHEVASSYADLRREGDVLVGSGRISLGDGAELHVRDTWRVDGATVAVRRSATVHGTAGGGFTSRLVLRRVDRPARWTDVEPFIPGVTYGNARQVAPGALGGWPARAAGARAVVVREDRAAAPLVAVRYDDGCWLAVLRPEAATGTTIAIDCVDVDGGETLVDDRLRFASVGGVAAGDALELGVWFPGTEGEHTHTSGGLPLGQPAAWRHRFHPIRDGLEQSYGMTVRVGRAHTFPAMCRSVWRWAWDTLAPGAEPAPIDSVICTTMSVLADQVCTVEGRTGVPLEADAVEPTATGVDASAVMGFVGANTDAGYLLLRLGEEEGLPRWREAGAAILDTFAAIALDPPAAEGFDTRTAAPTTYRTFRDRPAVYARSVAEGCLAMLRAAVWEAGRGRSRPGWMEWARSGGEWLVGQQHTDGSLPRAWEARTGAVLDASPSSSHVVVPFLTELWRATGQDRYLTAARAAGEYAWLTAGGDGSYAGATLDNPNVVDKEAAILAAEAFVALHDATGDDVWVDRAESAATIAETWTYIWDVPMPEDADDAALHWKRGIRTTGHQLITTGASMTDGFLAVNAAVFARLWRLTGDEHWLAVARLVTHGSTTMLALDGRVWDLRGAGWQQEHWCFGGRRGYGLNRRWLPWVAVAHTWGALRVRDLGADTVEAVLGR